MAQFMPAPGALPPATQPTAYTYKPSASSRYYDWLREGSGEGPARAVRGYPGAGGAGSALGVPVSPMMTGADQGPSFDDIWRNWQDSRSEFGQAVGSPVGPGSQRFGAFGAALMKAALQPEGFGDEAMRRQMTRLAEREAGVRQQQLGDMRGSAAQSGFFDSASRLGLENDLRGQSSQRLNSAELDFLLQDALLKSQNRGQAIQGGLGLSQIDARMNELAAMFAANQQRPLGQGGAAGEAARFGEGGEFSLLTPEGRLRPFHADGTPMTDFEKEMAKRQRAAYVAQFGS